MTPMIRRHGYAARCHVTPIFLRSALRRYAAAAMQRVCHDMEFARLLICHAADITRFHDAATLFT